MLKKGLIALAQTDSQSTFPYSMSVSSVTSNDGFGRRGTDSMTWYLTSIGREPLLTPAEEIELGNQVQIMMRLVEEQRDDYSIHERKIIKIGRRS